MTESLHGLHMHRLDSLRCSHTQSVDTDEDLERNLDRKLRWVRQHWRLLEAFAHMR